ncbi:MAG TPA: bifunctional transaldolase/phosoglucose isomerase [Bacteroidota bacterium]
MNNLLKLIEQGQSYWMDNLSRHMIRSGELKRRVTKEGLRGITSNPTIFNKAISGSRDYDGQIKQLVGRKKSVREIYEALTVKDVQDACDMLRPVYDESDGIDGFVSLEVSPYLAHDTEGTMAEVRRLFNAVDRPNVLIKIPGTPAGAPAIEQMLYEGINVNITLLFSIESYEAVAEAYVRALERRAAEGNPLMNVASVASFFLSRIDVLVDQLLGHLIRPEASRGKGPYPENLLGKTAVANAKLAYQSFKRTFSGDRWQTLVEKGARVQRPLWASTSTKNPLYKDIRYVEPLIGANTVNTMPEETIAAFADHGVLVPNTVEEDLDEAGQVFRDLEQVGIDIDFVTRQLMNEGVQKFIDPYDELMKTLASQRQEFLFKKGSKQSISPGSIKSSFNAALSSLDEAQFARRLFAKDPTLWSSDPGLAVSIRNRLGWLDRVDEFCRKADEIKKFALNVKRAGFKHVVLLGMGGSSLCPEVCRDTFGSAKGWPELIVLDNTSPEAVGEAASHIDIERSLFIVASKSGTTTETASFYRYFFDRLEKRVDSKAGGHFVAITDPGSPLIEEARNKKFRAVFENPEDIGGRYSALSYFGLVPMALIGIDVSEMLNNAHQMQLSCGPFIPTEVNPGVSLGTLLGMGYRHGRDKVTFVLSESVRAFGYWVEQLLAESTGKQGRGLVPVEGEPLAPPSAYSNDRVFVSISTDGGGDKSIQKKLEALERAGHPVVRITLKEKLDLGAEFYRWEFATATAGSVMGVNAFDEPNVAESKKNMVDLLDEWKQKGSFTEGQPIVENDGIKVYCDESSKWLFQGKRGSVREFLNAFLRLAKAPDYVALLAYLHRTDARHRALQTIRLKLRRRLKTPTTLGYGPRYLHSTGQLHKGGPNSGVFIMFTADSGRDLQIPGEEYGFATLQRSQALGDFRSLNDKERRVVRVHLGSDTLDGLKKISSYLS